MELRLGGIGRRVDVIGRRSDEFCPYSAPVADLPLSVGASFRRCRSYAALTTLESSPGADVDAVDPSEPVRSLLGHRVHAGLLLVRAPLVTRDLTSFEKAFYLYQRRLNERLALPFTRYFYFKKGTPADLEWKRKIKDRRTAARDIGRYHAYSDESWNDEVRVGAKESEVEHQVDALVHDAETSGLPPDEEMGEKRKEAVDRPFPRVTEADRQGHLDSLNRRLDRTLYLLARKPDGRWRLPAAELLRRESLHQVWKLSSPSRAISSS